jgi:hypothetical protein
MSTSNLTRLNPVPNLVNNWITAEQSCWGLTIRKLANNFPAVYANQRFFTLFTRSHFLFVVWARQIHSTPFHPIPFISVLILYSRLRLDFPSGAFPSGFPQNPIPICRLHHMYYMLRPSHPSWFDQPYNIWSLSSPAYNFIQPPVTTSFLSQLYTPTQLKYSFQFHPGIYNRSPSFSLLKYFEWNVAFTVLCKSTLA